MSGIPGQPTHAGGNASRALKDATLISESTFQLALPAGWKESAPSGGATFARSPLVATPT